MKKFSLVCNTPNIDFEYMFTSKFPCSELKLFFANSIISKKYKHEGVKTSSVSKKNGVGVRFILDIFISFYVWFLHCYRRIDVVVFDSAHISNIPLAILLKISGFKLVFTIHDWLPHPGKSYHNVMRYNKFVENFLADAFVVFSDVDSNSSVPIFKSCLSGFYFKNKTNPKCEENKKQKSILFFGRIEPYKGLKNMKNIIPAIRQLGIYNPVVIAGSGYDDCLEELKLIEGVSVINRYISDEEVDKLFSSAAVSVLPYESASQSGVVLMSYSYGVPVVAFNVGSIPEYVTESACGAVVEYGDFQEFARIVCNIILGNNDSDSGKRLNEIFSDKYSRKASKEHFSDLVKQISKYFS